MVKHGRDFDMAKAWDRASEEYLARRGDDADAVSYGNLAPSEAELSLLGDLRGLRVLDYGCGGGQNALACASAGATVVGVDVSGAQLAAAARLAQGHLAGSVGHAVAWIHGGVESQEIAALAPFDLVLALQVLPYVEDAAATLGALCTLLRPGGRLVLSLDHPLRNTFYDLDDGELSPFPLRPYTQIATLTWHFAPGVPMQMLHAPLASWIEWAIAAGLIVETLIEALAPHHVCDELWPEDSPLAPLRMIPHTAIIVARTPS